MERYGPAKPSHKILQAHPTVSDTLMSRIRAQDAHLKVAENA